MTEKVASSDSFKYPSDDELKNIFNSVEESLKQIEIGETALYSQFTTAVNDEVEIQITDGPLKIDVSKQPIYRLIKGLQSANPVWSELSSDFNLCYMTGLAVSSEDPDTQILLPLYRALKEAVDDSGFNSVEIRSAMNGYRGRAEDLTQDVIKRYQP